MGLVWRVQSLLTTSMTIPDDDVTTLPTSKLKSVMLRTWGFAIPERARESHGRTRRSPPGRRAPR